MPHTAIVRAASPNCAEPMLRRVGSAATASPRHLQEYPAGSGCDAGDSQCGSEESGVRNVQDPVGGVAGQLDCRGMHSNYLTFDRSPRVRECNSIAGPDEMTDVTARGDL